MEASSTLCPLNKSAMKFIPVVLYTLGMIYTYSGSSSWLSSAIDTYGSGISIFLILIGVMIFASVMSINFLTDGCIGLERIKTLVLCISLLTLLALYYLFREKPLTWWSAIMYGIFSMLYLIYVLTVFSISPLKSTTVVSTKANIIAYSFMAILGTVFVGFMLELTKTTNASNLSPFSLLSSGFITAILLGTLATHHFTPSTTQSISSPLSTLKTTQKILSIFTGVGIITLFLIWLSIYFKNLPNSDVILGIVLKLGFLVVCIMTIRTIFGKRISKTMSSPVVQQTSSDVITTASNHKITVLKGLAAIIIASGIFVGIPRLRRLFRSQGGKSIINQPIPLDVITTTTFSKYSEDSTVPSYEYGLSFWVYINSAPPNTSVAYNDYAYVMSFGNSPNIMYNGKTGSLMVTMRDEYISDHASKFGLNPKNNQERIVYTRRNMDMQRWVNIVINYSGGTMDVFVDGKLERSVPGVVPYMVSDTTQVGQEDGISGGICNVLYFDKPVTMPQMYYLYDWQKTNTPPVL
jgi:hypothetical protein